MGSCVSFSRSPPAASAAESPSSPRAPVATATVVNVDGSMAQFVRAGHGARCAGAGAGGGDASARFLCGADELVFDAPPRALAAGEALRPRQLYFVLPAPMLRRPLSGNDMAVLAVRAATALAAEAGLGAAGGAISSPQRRKKQAGSAAGKGRRRQSTARVAPLLVVSSSMDDDGLSGGSWNSDTHGGGLATGRTVHEDGSHRTVGKTSRGASSYRTGARRRPGAGVQRLSAIAEDEESDPLARLFASLPCRI